MIFVVKIASIRLLIKQNRFNTSFPISIRPYPISNPRSDIKTKYKKIFLRRLPLSRFLAKTLRVNKIAMKTFTKNLSFGIDFKLKVP